ncbi:MAG TPA: ABC transporter permease [Candidatus Limnocylindrales bacterium]|nr:ABC transporter permease [Candidatus Limnocylindrales bacterium]
MIQFIVRRLLISIPVIFGVMFIVFLLSRIVPGDPCAAALGERANPKSCETFNARIGLSLPILPFVIKDGSDYGLTSDPASLTNNQFVVYLRDLASGDLGTSVKHGRPVTTLLFERLPTTVELTFYALVFAIIVGVGLGIIAASRHNSKRDVLSMMVANLGVSIPVFVLGLMLAYAFGVLLKDTAVSLPPSGRLSAGFRFDSIPEAWGLTDLTGIPRGILDFLSNMYTINGLVTGQFGLFADAMRHLILPAIALGTIPMAIIARMTRSSLLDVLGREYVRTAEAKGLRPRLVLLRHGLRNALLPVVTVIGLSVASLLSGAVLTETIFGLTGIGLTVFESISSRDYVVIQGMALLVALIYVVVNLITDISYGFLDARVRVS